MAEMSEYYLDTNFLFEFSWFPKETGKIEL